METKTTARYFGKCLFKQCRKVFVRDFPVIGGNRLPVVISFEGWDTIFSASLAGKLRCECGHRVSNWKPLKAKLSSKHECGAKCLTSKGPSCECSCGGKNHGAGYLLDAQ